METKQQKCERIAKEMRQDFLSSGIPKEQHVAAVALILSHLLDIREELQQFVDGCKQGLAAYRAGKVLSWDDVKKELHLEG